jgi:hypothetical protein
MGYQPEQWHDLFVAIAGAGAALAGLIFVAVSLNLKQIIEGPALPSVAARSLAVLVALVLMSTFVLTPGQNHVALGVEILVLGLGLLIGVMATTLRTMLRPPPQKIESAKDAEDPDYEILLQWKIGHISLALLCTVPMVVAGASLWAGAGGGLYWALAEIIVGLVASVLYAWVLLIEILR